jgi:hypothetical protein
MSFSLDDLTTDGVDFWLFGYGYVTILTFVLAISLCDMPVALAACNAGHHPKVEMAPGPFIN